LCSGGTFASGVLDGRNHHAVCGDREVASAYGHHLILLLLGGFLLSTAMEKSGAHPAPSDGC